MPEILSIANVIVMWVHIFYRRLGHIPHIHTPVNDMNRISVAGILTAAPEFHVDHGIEMIRVRVKIHRAGLNKDETLTLMSKDKEVIKKVLWDDLHKGDLFMTSSGYIETVTYTEDDSWSCRRCNSEVLKSHKAEIMNIIFTDYQFARDFLNDGSAIGVNEVYLTGIVKTDPFTLGEAAVGPSYNRAKFKLAVPMMLYKEMRTQYPYIVTFKDTATFTANTIKKGDRILLHGALQERNYLKIEKETKCPYCGYVNTPKLYTVKREIIADRFEFIRGNEDLEKDFSESLNQDGYSLESKEEERPEKDLDIRMGIDTPQA